MNKLVKTLTAVSLAAGLSFSVLLATPALAADYTTPAEALAGVTGRTIEDIIEESVDNGKSYGIIAYEAGKLEEFQAELLAIRESLLEQKVIDGSITETEKTQIIDRVRANQAICTGTIGVCGLGKGGCGLGNGTCINPNSPYYGTTTGGTGVIYGNGNGNVAAGAGNGGVYGGRGVCGGIRVGTGLGNGGTPGGGAGYSYGYIDSSSYSSNSSYSSDNSSYSDGTGYGSGYGGGGGYGCGNGGGRGRNR